MQRTVFRSWRRPWTTGCRRSRELKLTAAAAATYLVNGAAPQPGAIFHQKNLARTFRTLARGAATRSIAGTSRARSSSTAATTAAFSRWTTSRRTSREWVEPISTTYHGHTLYEIPPNGQGLTALLLLNILEGIDLTCYADRAVRYYHTMIEATKIAFADRNRYIADPAFAKVPVKELL